MDAIDVRKLLLIVVGARLEAEASDRPLAYQLGRRIETWLKQRLGPQQAALMPLVCCDVWYLNNTDLHTRPMISIGGPQISAVAAYLYRTRLPMALQVDQRVAIQLDPDMHDLRVSLWGSEPKHTAAAIDIFCQKYFEPFMSAVTGQFG